MPVREQVLAVLLAVAGVVFVKGISEYDTRAAWLVAAVLIAGWSWLLCTGPVDDEPEE